jgi:hypothetical protein
MVICLKSLLVRALMWRMRLGERIRRVANLTPRSSSSPRMGWVVTFWSMISIFGSAPDTAFQAVGIAVRALDVTGPAVPVGRPVREQAGRDPIRDDRERRTAGLVYLRGEQQVYPLAAVLAQEPVLSRYRGLRRAEPGPGRMRVHRQPQLRPVGGGVGRTDHLELLGLPVL